MKNGTVALLTGAPEHPRTRGICPYHVLTDTLTQFQSKRADYVPQIGFSPASSEVFRTAPLSKKVQRGPQRPQSSTHSLEARH